MWSNDWIALIVLVGVCLLSLLWTVAAAPGFRVRGRHVLLTGASSGLGLAIAKKYAKAGAKLSLVGESADALEHARQAIATAAQGDAADVFVFEADAADEEHMQRAVAAANDFHGSVTEHLVHAARTGAPGFFWEQDVAQLRRAMDVNYMAAVVLIKTALPAMIESKVRGRVVLVTDVESLAFPFGSSGYAGSKCALRGLADALRNELGLYNVSVSVFYPGKLTFNRIEASECGSTDGNAAPSTPVPGQATTTTGYSTFEDADSSGASKQFDREAQTLVNGLWAGQYSITNSWNGFVLRMLSNGVAPRNNSPLELMLIFFAGVAQLAVNAVNERALGRGRPADGTNV